MVNTRSQVPRVEPVVEEEEAESQPPWVGKIQDFMTNMMAQQEEKMMGKMQEMLEAQEKRLREEARKVYGEPIINEASGGNFSGTLGGEDTKTTEENETRDEEVSNKKCSYKDFSMCKPPTYDGELNPVKLYNWIVEMEMAFYACQCLENQKVNFAITMLKEDALDWWLELKDNVSSKVLAKLTWEEFLEKMKERFCSKDEIRDLEREFMDLKKDKMSIKEYNAKFRKYWSFSRRLAPDDDTKVDCYKRGLPWNFKLNFGRQKDLNHAMRSAR